MPGTPLANAPGRDLVVAAVLLDKLLLADRGASRWGTWELSDMVPLSHFEFPAGRADSQQAIKPQV